MEIIIEISESMAFDLWCPGPKRLSLTQKPNDIFFDTSIVKIDVKWANGQEKTSSFLVLCGLRVSSQRLCLPNYPSHFCLVIVQKFMHR